MSRTTAMLPTKALIDGDVIVYACGFASDSAARRNDFITLPYEPLSYCLNGVRQKINSILETVGCEDYQIFLTGKDNYRFKFLPEYKANRKGAPRPHWYNQIRKHLRKEWGAVVVDGMEADDALGINQTSDTVICTIDKDLDTVPGYHYNWSPKNYERGVYEVSEDEAELFFYTQCLTGDATDNIPGLKKATGRVATAKLKKGLRELPTASERYLYVKEAYGDYDFHPMANCLWILRKEGEYWKAPNIVTV